MGIKWRETLLIAVALILLTACGGGGDSGPTLGSPAVEQKGQFIDSAVAGMTYVATPSGLTGTTDASGTYSYEAGDSIEFFVGDISIGSAPAAPLMTPITLVASVVSGTVDVTHTVVINIARFLQSIDEDGDLSNGIQISAAITTAAMGETLDFFSVTFATDADAVLAALASATGTISGLLVDGVDAISHLSGSISICEHTGTYSGTWAQTSPDMSDNGTWMMSASIAGSVSGSGSSSVLSESFDLVGSVSADGTTTAGSTTTGAEFNGTVGSGGTLSGTWTNSTFGTSGTFTGSRTGSATSCPSSSTGTGGGSSTSASLTMSGQPDFGSMFTVFNSFDRISSGTGSVAWLDYDTSATTSGTGRSLTVGLALGEVTSVVLAGSRVDLSGPTGQAWSYLLDCSVGDCSNISVDTGTQSVTFSDLVVPPTAEGSDATGPITLEGTLSYEGAISTTPGGGGGSGVDTSAIAGTYSGTLDGSIAGSWTLTVDSSGNLNGAAMPDTGGTNTFSASIDATGLFSGSSEADGYAINGNVASDGSVLGTLFFLTDALVFGGGSFSGSLDAAASGGGGGSGGSGEDTSAYAGTYTGTFIGEYSGSWVFNIDASGSLTGTVDPDPVERPTFVLDVSVSSAGAISGGGMTGTVNSDGTISGTWPGDVSGGTFSGSRVSG